MPLSVSVDDILEFVVKGSFDGAVEVNNVFHYIVNTVGGATLNEFAAGLFATVVANVQNTISDDVEFFTIEAKILDTDGNLVNGETYSIPTGSGIGQISGESLPSHDCISFKYVRPDASFRHGFKRFAGVPESGQENGLPTGTYLTGLNTLAGVLEDVQPAYSIDSGTGEPDAPVATSEMQPIILQRIINGDPISPVNVGRVTDVVFDLIGTQNSRKRGRGV